MGSQATIPHTSNQQDWHQIRRRAWGPLGWAGRGRERVPVDFIFSQVAELVNAKRDVNIDVNVQTSYRFESYSDYIKQIKFYNYTLIFKLKIYDT